MNIGFLGLGKLGLPVSLAVEDKGHKVYGYDISKKTIEDISNLARAENVKRNPKIYHYNKNPRIVEGYKKFKSIRSLCKNKEITNGELLAYINDKVSSKALEQGRKQNPELLGENDKVLIRY